MDLVSGTPIWLHGRPAEAAPEPTLHRDLDCEVAIVGAGITGALLADRFSVAGCQVVVLDRHYRAYGSTAACTALVQFEIDTPLAALTKLIGERNAIRAYRSSYRATQLVPAIVRSLGTPVHLVSRPCLYLASSLKDAEALADEAARRRIAGVEAQLLSGNELRRRYGIDRPAAIRSETAAVLDPVALTRALLARAERCGAKVYEGVSVDNIEAETNGVALETAAGPVVRAGHVVFATGYEAGEYLPEKVASLKSTYAFASRPVPRARLWPEEAMLWETARPYTYARTTLDARILVGGADDDFQDPARREANMSIRIEQLREAFQEIVPSLELEVDTMWAGTFAETNDGLPYIGPSPSRAHASFALGYGGNGITFSVLAAEIIAAQLAGEQHPEEDLYRFGR